MSILKLEGVTKTFKMGSNRNDAVHNITWEFDEGLNFIYGKSGSGKTTLLHTMAGFEKPTKGKVIYEGKSVYDDFDMSKLHCHDFGFVFQTYNLIPEFNVKDNIMLPMKFDKNKDHSIYDEIIKILGIDDKLRRYPSTLSGGEQQRVAIARAIVNRPKIIFADEPTGNLDENNGRIVIEFLTELCRKYSLSLFLVTHDMDLLKYADFIYQMKDGVLEKE